MLNPIGNCADDRAVVTQRCSHGGWLPAQACEGRPIRADQVFRWEALRDGAFETEGE